MSTALQRAIRHRNAIPGLEQLYAEHARAFALSPSDLEAEVVAPISAKIVAEVERHCREATPKTEARDDVAEAFEYAGELDRAIFIRRLIEAKNPTIKNDFSIGRLLVLSGNPEAALQHFARRFCNYPSLFFLGLVQAAALSPTPSKILTPEIADNIRRAAEFDLDNLAIQFAAGLVEVVAGNSTTARRYLAAALILEERHRKRSERRWSRHERYEFDPWIVAIAQQLVLDPISCRPPFNAIVPSGDPFVIALAGANVLRSAGAILFALAQFEVVLAHLAVTETPLNFFRYRMHKLIYFRGNYYAVPHTFDKYWVLPRPVSRRLHSTTIRAVSSQSRASGRWPKWLYPYLRLGRAIQRRLIGYAKRVLVRLPGTNFALRQTHQLRMMAFSRIGRKWGLLISPSLLDIQADIENENRSTEGTPK